MMASGHQTVGVTAGLLSITLLPQVEYIPNGTLETILFFVFVLFGSLLPDIDTPSSTLGRKFWRALMYILLAAAVLYLFAPEYLETYREQLKVFVMLTFPLLVMVKSHRKMTHSVVFIGLLLFYHLVITYFFEVPPYYFVGFMLGVCSHLLGDYLTKRGIPFFYPISKKYFRFIITMRTGSSAEKIMVTVLSIWNVWYLISQVF
ncbi:metal-dependent hydrolase [Halobacillus sp. Marseille-Q1614]|uniref:metal-dependent hydrolase n=1 Tax=Halobacillus sp. Marseille-Q1614 TaxID=2709134 RepID=UPI00156FEC64|nr:metal-dependent hydrolase [Halobacillus sp. Marseille-Q1614]